MAPARPRISGPALGAGLAAMLLPMGAALELRGAAVRGSCVPLAFGVHASPAPFPPLGSPTSARQRKNPALCGRPCAEAMTRQCRGTGVIVRMSGGGDAAPQQDETPLIRLVTFLTRYRPPACTPAHRTHGISACMPGTHA